MTQPPTNYRNAESGPPSHYPPRPVGSTTKRRKSIWPPRVVGLLRTFRQKSLFSKDRRASGTLGMREPSQSAPWGEKAREADFAVPGVLSSTGRANEGSDPEAKVASNDNDGHIEMHGNYGDLESAHSTRPATSPTSVETTPGGIHHSTYQTTPDFDGRSLAGEIDADGPIPEGDLRDWSTENFTVNAILKAEPGEGEWVRMAYDTQAKMNLLHPKSLPNGAVIEACGPDEGIIIPFHAGEKLEIHPLGIVRDLSYHIVGSALTFSADFLVTEMPYDAILGNKELVKRTILQINPAYSGRLCEVRRSNG